MLKQSKIIIKSWQAFAGIHTEAASVWMPAKACHDLIMIFFVLALPVFIMYTDKDSNLIRE